jgi:hypothetical protein
MPNSKSPESAVKPALTFVGPGPTTASYSLSSRVTTCITRDRHKILTTNSYKDQRPSLLTSNPSYTSVSLSSLHHS